MGFAVYDDSLSTHQGGSVCGSACSEDGFAQADGVCAVVAAAGVDGMTAGGVGADHAAVVFAYEQVLAFVSDNVDA